MCIFLGFNVILLLFALSCTFAASL